MTISVKFKTKIKESTSGRPYVILPKIKTSHVNMSDARKCPQWSRFSNSPLFETMLYRECHKITFHGMIYLDDASENFKVLKAGFLAECEIII